MTAGLTSDVREPRHDRAILGLSDRCGCLLLVRHTTFRFCLNPTVEQHAALARHAGASRFAFNTSLRLVKHALTSKRSDPALASWTGFDLINQFNAWKKTETAGRVIAVDGSGAAEVARTGLGWRTEVCQQVFEEAAVDLGRALAAFTASRKGERAGRRVGFPRLKRKGRVVESFRLRNKRPKGGTPPIRVGDGAPRSVTLPGIGMVRVYDDTRHLRRLIATGRGRILFATVARRAGRWYVSLNVEAADLHPAVRPAPDHAAAARPCRHPQTERISEPQEGRRPVGAASSADPQPAPPCPTRGRHRAHPTPKGGAGRPQRDRHAWQPPPRQVNLRRRLDRTRPHRGLPAGVARRPGRDRGPVVPVVQDLLRMRPGRPGPDSRATHLPVRSLRIGTGPRPQRRHEHRRVGRPRGPGPRSNRPGHQRPRRGTLWPTRTRR